MKGLITGANGQLGYDLVKALGNFQIIPLIHADESERFLGALAGVSDPEVKRKTIGKLFIDVFEAEARKVGGAEFLAQGTLYPDVIESVSAIGGPSPAFSRYTARKSLSWSRPMPSST